MILIYCVISQLSRCCCKYYLIMIEMTLKIFNTRLMWPWVMKLLVDIYLDIWIRGLCKKVGHYS